MKNGAVLTAYLDFCEEMVRLINGRTLESAQAANEHIAPDRHRELWQACIDAGWTQEEIDAAYTRRTGYTKDQ